MTRSKENPSKRGWTRKLRLGLKIGLPTLAGALAVYGILLLGASLVDSKHFQLRHIRYQGVDRLDREALHQLITKMVPSNPIFIELDHVRQLVEAENWVRSATVRRQLPDTLWIIVSEREPVAVAAIDDELRIVDAEGRLLDAFGPQYSGLDRPIVKGLKNLALENAQEDNRLRMGVYLEIVAEMEAAGPELVSQLSEIDVSDVQRVAVIPTRKAIPVVLGHERYAQRFQTFLSQLPLLDRLQKQHGAIESVDVSFENRIIVQTPHSTAQKTQITETS